jgi:uncharacterized protein (TIGR00369 family)
MSTSADDPRAVPEDHRLELMRQIATEGIPHNRELGMELLEVWDDGGSMRLPYREDLVGNPLTGVLAGGVITTLLDAACGMAVMIALAKPAAIATLDLRIDYLRPATAHRDVNARAECYRITQHVAFARAIAYDLDASDPIASAAGAFMITPAGTRHR